MLPEIRLYRLMQSCLHQYTEPLSDEGIDRLPAGGGNSINWIMGHLVLGNEYGSRLLGQPVKYLDAMLPVYGPGTKATDDRDVIVSAAELRRRFDETGDALVQHYEAADPATLAAPQQTGLFPDDLPEVGHMMHHLLTTHFAIHLGQISQQRRQRGLDPLVG